MFIPSSKHPSPSWDLPLVLKNLTGKLFEPMAPYTAHLLTLKTVFLGAITLSRRVGELQAFRHDLPYLMLHAEGMLLFPDASFLLKMIFDFHLQATIHLSVFYLSPENKEEQRLHTFNVKRALHCYLTRTALDRRVNNLFIAYED